LLGQAAGWRAAFWAVTSIGLAAFAVLYAFIPAIAADPAANLAREFRALRRTQVLLAMLISTLSSVALFCVFTYIAPLLENVTHISAHGVSLVLLLLGVGLTAGNLVGGRLADWRLMPAILGTFAILALALLVLYAAIPSASAGVAVLTLWAATSFALVSPLQMRVVGEAVEAPNLAATLNQGAFNLGNACGAWLGGLAISAGWSYRDLPLVSVGVTVLAFGLTGFSMWLDRLPGRAARQVGEASQSPLKIVGGDVPSPPNPPSLMKEDLGAGLRDA
jgi:DHA1 family inner membrane transport protein